MSFLDNLAKNVENAADYTVRKAGELTEIAKIRMEIHNCNTHLTQCFEQLGRICYKKEKESGVDCSDPVNKYIAEIDQWKGKMATLRARLAQTQGCVICPSCGEQIAGKSVYCPVCGVKLFCEEPSPETDTDAATSCEECSCTPTCPCTDSAPESDETSDAE